ncbi:MAG: peptidase domain-containing ABC transporter [Bacteroidota bacterium]
MLPFPFYQQSESADCGPTCLKMIAKYYGKDVSIESIKDQSYLDKKGVSLSGLSNAAEAIGFHTQGARISWHQLRDEAPLPCIVHWNQNHFVVIYEIKNKGWFGLRRKEKAIIRVADPAYGRLDYREEDFIKHWQQHTNQSGGIAFLLEPTSKFYSSESSEEQKKLALSYLLAYLSPYKKYLIQLVLGLIVGLLISLALPFITQSIIDSGIGNHDVNFIILALCGQLFLNIGQTTNNLIQGWIGLHITSRVSIKMIAGFLAKLMRLPMSFFQTRSIGNIMQRINDQNRVQNFITTSLISILFSVVMIIMYSIVMWHYDVRILVIFYLGTSLYLSWIYLFLKLRRELDYKRFQQAANNQDALVELISGMQEIKLSGSEIQKRWEWEQIQVKLFKISVKGLALSQNQILGSNLIDQIKNLLITFVAAYAVIDGQITLGMMVAIQYITGQLNAPVQQFIGFIQLGQDAKISLDRLDEIYARADEENSSSNLQREIPTGNAIHVRELSFQYEGAASERVLDKISFTIPPNKVTAIVGSSGCGKTTLLKILLGIYSPTEGEVLLNTTPLVQISPGSWRKNCGLVMQDGYIFSDTIANNISLGDAVSDFQKIVAAARISNLTEFIETLPLGLSTVIGKDGHGLSAGQKQRILIARAVYKNAEFLFLDEPTNSLDAKNESSIVKNLDESFKNRTVVIIAHRLSTIKDADQILVLDRGKIIETGNHEQLMNQKAFYYNLFESQFS